MRTGTKLLLVFLGLSFYAVQVWHTLYDQMNWPFCAHNFYYHRSPLAKDLFRIVLEDNTGRALCVDPKHTLPIEGYRCGSILREIFMTNSDLEKKRTFSRLLLERLNHGGWESFDERSFSVKPTEGNRFVGVRIEKHRIDTSAYSETQQLPILKKEILYQYEKESVKQPL